MVRIHAYANCKPHSVSEKPKIYHFVQRIHFFAHRRGNGLRKYSACNKGVNIRTGHGHRGDSNISADLTQAQQEPACSSIDVQPGKIQHQHRAETRRQQGTPAAPLSFYLGCSIRRVPHPQPVVDALGCVGDEGHILGLGNSHGYPAAAAAAVRSAASCGSLLG